MPEYSDERTLTIIVNDNRTNGALPLSNVTQGVILMPTVWTAASIGFLVRDRSGNFYPIYSGGVIVQIVLPLANEAHAIPAAVFNANEVYLWSQTAAVNVPQLATRAIVVQIKE